MPPRRMSRHTFCHGFQDDVGDLILTEPEPYRYKPFADNRFHTVAEGDTLWGLAAKYFGSIPRADGLWWVIADFQIDPIHDPTLALTPGRMLVIPSLRTVIEEVFSESRRDE
jgi:hypothetical protein